jgi:acyl-coenzyme A thioesterase PaaI-like protein
MSTGVWPLEVAATIERSRSGRVDELQAVTATVTITTHTSALVLARRIAPVSPGDGPVWPRAAGCQQALAMTDTPGAYSSIPSRLNVSIVEVEPLVLRVHPVPTTCRLGSLRTSVLSFVVDAVAGIEIDTDRDAWQFTSDMAVRVRPLPAPAYIDARSTVLRAGRRSVTCEVQLVDDSGSPVGHGVLGFSRIERKPTDPPKPQVGAAEIAAHWSDVTPIETPLAEAAGIRVLDAEAGIVEVDADPMLNNMAGVMQGAMVALVAEVAAEEAASARLGAPAYVSELDIRYLQQVRGGPVRSSCEWLGDRPDSPIRVVLVDVGTGQLVTHVVARAG